MAKYQGVIRMTDKYESYLEYKKRVHLLGSMYFDDIIDDDISLFPDSNLDDYETYIWHRKKF